MFRCYLATVRGRVWGRQYLNRRFFELVRERFRSRLCFVVAFAGDEPIAGTFNVQKGDALYGRYWGALRDVRNLHFEVCYYAAVEHCIASGLARFEPGAGGDYKQARGFDGAADLQPALAGRAAAARGGRALPRRRARARRGRHRLAARAQRAEARLSRG